MLEEADSVFMPETASARANSNKLLVEMLRRSRLFRDYETVFTKATGLPLTLRPLEYWQLAHHGKKHENPFCALLAERPATLASVYRRTRTMIDHTGVVPHTVTCPFGLTETAVPVKTRRDKSSDTCALVRCCGTCPRSRIGLR